MRHSPVTAKEWADRIGCEYATLMQRLHKGWSVERALTQKLRYQKKRVMADDA